MSQAYDPNRLYPGSVSPDRPDINRPARTQTSSGTLGQIEARYFAARDSEVLALDPALHSFIDVDVARLLGIARAAHAWSTANNAEKHRQAAEQIVASLRGISNG